MGCLPTNTQALDMAPSTSNCDGDALILSQSVYQVSPGGPLHMSGSPVVSQGKYITEEVVYHQTDSGAVKYSLPMRRTYQETSKYCGVHSNTSAAPLESNPRVSPRYRQATSASTQAHNAVVRHV